MVDEWLAGFKPRPASCWCQSSWAQGPAALCSLELRQPYVDRVASNEMGRCETLSLLRKENQSKNSAHSPIGIWKSLRLGQSTASGLSVSWLLLVLTQLSGTNGQGLVSHIYGSQMVGLPTPGSPVGPRVEDGSKEGNTQPGRENIVLEGSTCSCFQLNSALSCPKCLEQVFQRVKISLLCPVGPSWIR